MLELGDLARRELVVVTGKGGVGKTTVAALLGCAFAASGRRTLVAEIDPRENLHQVLGTPPSGGEILRAGDRLWVQNLAPQRVLDEVVREQVPVGFLAQRVIESPIYQHFAAGAPGLKEMAVLGQALRLLRGLAGKRAPALDVVVLDAPATGHGVSLLAAPLLVSEVIHKGPIGRMSAEVAALVADAARTAVVAVAAPEEMPISEVLELASSLERSVGRRPDLAVVNGLFPPPPLEIRDDADLLWRERSEAQERELDRFRSAWLDEITTLPALPLERGPALLAALARASGFFGVAA